jgi:hypothetical protein
MHRKHGIGSNSAEAETLRRRTATTALPRPGSSSIKRRADEAERDVEPTCAELIQTLEETRSCLANERKRKEEVEEQLKIREKRIETLCQMLAEKQGS